MSWILLIVVFVWLLLLQSRVSSLEAKISGQRKKEAKSDLPQAKTTKSDLPAQATKRHTPPAIGQSDPFHWEEFFTKKFFAVLGAVSIVLAIGFFAVWSFANGWVGPIGRVALGTLVSLGLLISGEVLRTKYPTFFPYLSASGIAGLTITSYIARNVYQFLDPLQAFSAYVFIVLVGVFFSLRYRSRVLGNFSIVMGLIAPSLVSGDINEIGLLVYLLVLTIGGFVLSLRQKWPEILVFLFLGVVGYEGVIFDLVERSYLDPVGNDFDLWTENTNLVRSGFIVDQPWIFIAFAGVMHWLLGLGGVIRAGREKIVQKWNQKNVDPLTVMELVLMVISIVAFNAMAFTIFDWMEWPYFGFFVLVQGFGLFFLSEYLRKAGQVFFQRIALSGTLITVILATIWEIGTDQEVILTLALLLEGGLMLLGASKLQDRWVALFGHIALFLGSLTALDLELWYSLVGLVLYAAGVGYALATSQKKWEWVLGTIQVIWGIGLLLNWNFNVLGDTLSLTSNAQVGLFILPSALASLLAYSVIKTRSAWSTGLGLGTMMVSSLMGSEIVGRLGVFTADKQLVGLSILLLALLGYFTVLSSAFLEDGGKALVLAGSRVMITRLTLFCTTILTLVMGAKLWDDPTMTVFWMAWAGVLLALGMKNAWPNFRYAGIGTFLLIIAKLYLIDVWGWDTETKVIAFSVLGVALLGLSFYAQKNNNQ